MRADDPRHGTTAGSGAHYRDGEKPCDACRDARRRYYRRYNKQRQLGYVRRIRAGHGGVWERIDELHRSGYSFARLAKALDCIGGAHLYVIHTEGPDAEIRVGTWQRLADALASMKEQPTQLGTLRRLQALHFRGWPIKTVMAEAGLEAEVGKRALRGEHINFKAPTMLAIADVYERLCMVSPPSSAGSTRAKRRAEREGWVSPLAWDCIDTDPAPVGIIPGDEADVDTAVVERILAGDNRVRANVAERREVTRRWAASGRSLAELARVTGWKVERYVAREVAA